MRFRNALMASGAELMADGRFCAVGAGFEGIEVTSFPQNVPAMSVIVCFLMGIQDLDHEHMVRVSVLLPDGTEVGSTSNLKFKVDPRVVDVTNEIPVYGVVQINNLQLKEAGEYSTVFSMEGVEVGRVPLRVREVSGT